MPDGLLTVLATATPKPVGPSPSASPSAPSFDPNDVTPGTVGFIVTFAMVIVVIFLLRDLTRRVRRITLRGEEAERRAAEQAAAGGPAAATPPGGGPGGQRPGVSPGGPVGPAGQPPPGSGRRRPPSLKRPGEAPTAPS